MGMNRVQFQPGLSMAEFPTVWPVAKLAVVALESVRDSG